MQQRLKVYTGYDAEEAEAYRVATKTLYDTSKLESERLDAAELRARGLLWRPVDRRGSKRYDLISNAPASTDFAISRFLVPLLCQGGHALFTDLDVVFLSDVNKMLAFADDRYAVQVVQHNHVPTEQYKMVNKEQLKYTRKNWSSVMLFNIDHPGNRRLTLHDVNTRPGLWLHQFGWLHDSEIGPLPPRWNWLVNSEPRYQDAAIAHFTNGGPWLPGWVPADHDDIWLKAAAAA